MQAQTLPSKRIVPYTDESALSRYQTALSAFKKKNDKDFILCSQSIMDLCFLYALEHLDEQNVKLYQILGFPVIAYKKETNMLLVVPMLEDELMRGIRYHLAKVEIKLEEIVDKFISLVKAKNTIGEIMFIRMYQEEPPQFQNKILTPFGFIYVVEPLLITLE